MSNVTTKIMMRLLAQRYGRVDVRIEGSNVLLKAMYLNDRYYDKRDSHNEIYENSTAMLRQHGKEHGYFNTPGNGLDNIIVDSGPHEGKKLRELTHLINPASSA